MDYNQRAERYLNLAQEIDETKKKKGTLKIFFGYAAGVGKTYAMLAEAQSLRKEGNDVVVGYIEHHGRKETENMIKKLETIPMKTEKHKNLRLKEFDLDAALRRHPQILLVDELAHTNLPESRHQKRYQDVQELLNVGINVYTTLNVQHLESLQNILADHLNLLVQERVPDYIFDMATQIKLVDIDPEELLIRLRKGKIYPQSTVKKALKNFFTTSNLVALRELALRKMSLRLQNTIKNQTVEKLLVCVSGSSSSARVIRSAAQLAEAFNCELIAAYVKEPNPSYADNFLNANLNLARQLGAKIVKLTGEKPAVQIAEYAKISQVTKIILGSSPVKWFGLRGTNLITQLGIILPEVDEYIINEPQLPTQHLASKKLRQKWQTNLTAINPKRWIKDWIIMLSIIAASTLLGEGLFYFDRQIVNVVLLYILGLMFGAMVVEQKKVIILAALMAVLSFNYFFTQPYFSLATSSQYVLTFGLMLSVAIISNSWTLRIKNQALVNARRVYRTEVLLKTIQQLQSAKKTAEIIAVTAQQLQKLYAVPIIFYEKKGNQLGSPSLFPIAGDSLVATKYFSESEQAVAFWTLKNGQEAGAGTATLPNSKCWYLPIFGTTSTEVLAVAAFASTEKQHIEVSERNLLISILDICGQTFEKMQILKAKHQAEVRVQQEKLRADLLRGISHDLRTPLTNIAGSIDILRQEINALSRDEQLTLYNSIFNDASWLISLVENLLAMTHLETQPKIRHDPELVDDIINEALEHLSPGAEQHQLQVNLADSLLMVQADAKLVVQVVINIVNNAIKYTPRGSHIWLTAFRKNRSQVQFEIANDGPKLNEQELANLFKLFYTGERQTSWQTQRGLGIGLSLCKSVIETFGGKIWAKNSPEKGVCFYFTLPAWGDEYGEK
ncbi:sensor histidine kinase [Liquorilactobacillus sicerae]|uniref:sensor histidine kinase n=1 Tax=Liquorilactobacillus sicerae TaxID=1416943 RepID=UPI0024817B56|nr:sensor histidine kinase KdpD [Liquorilactobacillus sicerae]